MDSKSHILYDIKIVTINWNLKNDTMECLGSLIEAGATPEQIILVDNGSTDGSIEEVRHRFGDRLDLILNSTNYGYVTALNQGIKKALESATDWILLLNNDTIVATEFFTAIIRYLNAGTNYAILAPAIYYYNDPQRIWYLGEQIIPGTLLGYSPYHGKIIDHLPDVLSVDFVSGCAMMVQREVFKRVGLFDPELIMYGEEVDFIWRARLAGFRCATITNARIWHKISLSANKLVLQANYLRVRNQIRFYRKHSRQLQRPIMLIFTIIKSLCVITKNIVKCHTEFIPSQIKGWIDGWFGS